MNKVVRIVLISLLAAAVIAAVLVIVWIFPLREEVRAELRAGFASPEGERYACDLTYTSRIRGKSESSCSYKVISNARSEGVWRYVANARSGCYMAGDTCFEYDGDPLDGGTLVEEGEDAVPPQPAYMDYFGFLFGGGAFADEAKHVNKFPWSGAYTFSLPPERFMGREDVGYILYDNTNYHYSDLSFEVETDGAGRVIRAQSAYSYSVDAHWEFRPGVFPDLSGDTVYIEAHSGEAEAEAVFTYPESDMPIETDVQFDLSRDLSAARAEKSATRCSQTYLIPDFSEDPAAGYVFPEGAEGETLLGTRRTFASEDLFVVYYGGKADLYRASTLEKLCTLDHYLNIESVDADGGRLLVTLTDGIVYAEGMTSLPWEKNLTFLVYDLSDYSVQYRYKAAGKSPDYGGAHYGCLIGDLIAYNDRSGSLALHDMASGETRGTGRRVYGEVYADRENGRILFEEDLQEYRAYGIATGEVSVYDWQPPEYALHIGGYTMDDESGWRETITVMDAGGNAVHAFAFRESRIEFEDSFAVRMEDGKYFCGLYGCLFVFDPAAIG